MPARATQISAFVSSETKEQIERYTRSTGVKKNYLVEEALRHHLTALHELPADLIVHPNIVITRASAKGLDVSLLARDSRGPCRERQKSTPALAMRTGAVAR